MVSARIPATVSATQRSVVGSAAGFLAGVVSLTLSLGDIWTISALVIPAMIFCFSNGVAGPAAQTGAMSAIKEIAGTASGPSMFLGMTFAGIATQVLSANGNSTPMDASVSLALFTLLSLAAALTTIKKDEDSSQLSNKNA